MTFDFRIKNGISKDHHLDATCIAASAFGVKHIDTNYKPFEIIQFRNHNRQIVIRQIVKIDVSKKILPWQHGTRNRYVYLEIEKQIYCDPD